MSATGVPVAFEEVGVAISFEEVFSEEKEVSQNENEVSQKKEASHFPLQFLRAGTAYGQGMELPQVVRASRLVDRPAAATVLTGIEQFDALTGGLPRGGLTEICGPASSGRTSVLLALMASMTAQGELCALVDASDSFDPKSAEAAGVELRRLLWVRCSKHRVIGRLGDRVNKTASLADSRWSRAKTSVAIGHQQSAMNCLEQALKTTDLLLQGGGFGLVVVDLGDVPAQAARRVPLTSWFRFRRAVENTRTVLLVLEQEPYAKTCASVVMKLAARLQASGCRLREKTEPAHARIFSGLQITAEIVRSAAQGKKPVRSASTRFASRAQWAG